MSKTTKATRAAVKANKLNKNVIYYKRGYDNTYDLIYIYIGYNNVNYVESFFINVKDDPKSVTTVSVQEVINNLIRFQSCLQRSKGNIIPLGKKEEIYLKPEYASFLAKEISIKKDLLERLFYKLDDEIAATEFVNHCDYTKVIEKIKIQKKFSFYGDNGSREGLDNFIENCHKNDWAMYSDSSTKVSNYDHGQPLRYLTDYPRIVAVARKDLPPFLYYTDRITDQSLIRIREFKYKGYCVYLYLSIGGPRYEPNDDISGVTQIIQSISNDIEYKTHTGYYNSVAIIKKLENAKILWKHDTEILNYLDRKIKYAQKHELKPAYFS